MSQNRDAPAYQEYAAAMMARADYRLMTLQQRGLLYSLRLECWVNVFLPSDPHKLAKVLGFDSGDITESLRAVMPFFQTDGKQLFCPELIDYRAHLEARKERMSEGGKRGQKTQKEGKRKSLKSRAGIEETTTFKAPCEVPYEGALKVLVQSSTEKPSTPQPGGAVEVDPFVDEYMAAEQRQSMKRTRAVF
jgi:hypothetical protein